MRAIFFRLALVGAMSAVAPLAHAQLLTHRDLSYSMAKTSAETAIDSCSAKGYAVSAVVVDRAGDVIVAMRADNAGPHTMENARRKAYTARSFRTSTTAYAKRFADNDPVARQSHRTAQMSRSGGAACCSRLDGRQSVDAPKSGADNAASVRSV